MKRRLLILLIAALWLTPSAAEAQADTVEVRGHGFVLTHTVAQGEWETESILLQRLGAEAPKPLLRHTVREAIADCNSQTVEVGGYATGDTTLTFYTAWTYDHENRFPVGVRKQVYRVTASGMVLPLMAEVCLRQCPECEDHAYYLHDSPENPTHDARRAWQLFFACYQTHYQAHWVDGKAGQALFKEVRQALRQPLAAAYRQRPGLMRL